MKEQLTAMINASVRQLIEQGRWLELVEYQELFLGAADGIESVIQKRLNDSAEDDQ